MQRLQRREDVRTELEETLRRAQVLQPVQAEVAHIGAGEVRRRLRQEHLPPVPGGRDPRRPVHVEPDIALVRPERLAGVQPHPHAHRAARKRALRVGGGGHGVGRAREGDEERVALRVDLDPVVLRAKPPAARGGARRARRRTPSPSSCSSRVEPSMSVKRKVTVPVGSSGCTLAIIALTLTVAESTAGG